MQVARMLNVELMSELLMFLLDGLTSKSQAAIRKTYGAYDDAVLHEKALKMRSELVLDAIDEIYGTTAGLGGLNEFSRSPFNGQGWFYVLFAFLHDVSFATTVKVRPSAKAKALQIAKIRKHLDRKAIALESGALDDKLLKALRGAATDKASRQARYDFLREGFRG